MTTETVPPVKATPTDGATFEFGDQAILPPARLANEPTGSVVHVAMVVVVEVVDDVVEDVVEEVVVDDVVVVLGGELANGIER